MVATRNHPKDFEDSPAPTPTPEPSPRKRNTRASTTTTNSIASPSKATTNSSQPPTPTRTRAPRAKSTSGWSHTPSNLTLLWLAISLPLVIWDTGYVLLRPYSMPGGSLHFPIWSPYGLYGTIDHTYGFKAYNANSGWTGAQGAVNALETVAYGVYLYLVYMYGEHERGVQGTGAPDREDLEVVPGVGGKLRALSESRTVEGRVAGVAVLVAYTAAQITFWKTVLYWLIEVFSGFENIGHNDAVTLFFMWIVPNGAWLILPAYMMYVFGQEILQGLDLASGSKKTR